MMCVGVASFSFGIALQQAALFSLILFQIVTTIIYGGKLSSLFERGRRIAFLLYVVLIGSAVFAQYRQPALQASGFHWAFLAFWVCSPALIEKLDWVRLHRYLLIFSAPGLLFSVYWLLQPAEIHWALSNGFQTYPRAEGFVSNPITYAEGLVVISCWSLMRLIEGERERERERFGMVLHLVLSVLVVTFSRVRAGVVGYSLLFLLAAVVAPRWRRFSLGVWGVMIVLFIGGVAVFGFNTVSIQERFDLFSHSLGLFWQHPLFGIGPGRFREFVDPISGLAEHPHNSLLGIATESGVFGLLFYLVFLGVIGYQLFWLVRHSTALSVPTWVPKSLACIFLCYWSFSMFDYNFADTELLILHALHWGIVSQLFLQQRERMGA